MPRTARALLVLVLGCVATAGAEPTPERIGLEGAPGVVTRPSGTWKRSTETPAAGQWFVQFHAADGSALLRAYVFPVRASRDPDNVLVQAVDQFIRGLRIDGFGLPTRRTLDVWGCPAAEATLAATRGRTRIEGRARLLLLTDHQWALAVGYATATAASARRTAVDEFVQSLEPAEPRFHTRVFHRPIEHDAVAVSKAGEAPVTVGQVAAVETLLEAGLGARFPLGIRAQVRRALEEDAQRGPPSTRQGYRDAGASLAQALPLEPVERDPLLAGTGRRILDAILARAQEGYPPALRFAAAWREVGRLSIGASADGLTVGHVANLIELSAFLASVAADAEVVADGATRAHLHARLERSWPNLGSEEHAALRAVGRTWATLRHAWDRATAERRLAFRVAVATRLASEQDRTSEIGAATDARALKRWMAARPREDLNARLLTAAFALRDEARLALIDVLDVKDAHAFHFGW